MNIKKKVTEAPHYLADYLLNLHPGQPIGIYVSQENIDRAVQGDKRNCAVVLAIFTAIDATYRAEVEGNHVFIWIDHGNEKWQLEFYMTEEVWNLARQFDKNRSDVQPAMLTINFRSGVQKNRIRTSSRRVHKYEPTAPKAVVESQVLSKPVAVAQEAPASEPETETLTTSQPIVKPISVPGQRTTLAKTAKASSRWDREGFYTKKAS
jgi:hypothetical protein